MNARTIDWDSPAGGLSGLFESRRPVKTAPRAGCIITARYHGTNVRMKVIDRDGDKRSVAQVIGVDDQSIHHELQAGDTVIVPDKKRTVVRYS